MERREVVWRRILVEKLVESLDCTAFAVSEPWWWRMKRRGVVKRDQQPMPPSLWSYVKVWYGQYSWPQQHSFRFQTRPEPPFQESLIQKYTAYPLKRSARPVSANRKIADVPCSPPRSCQAASSKRKAPTSSCSAPRCWAIFSFSFPTSSGWSLASRVFCRFPARSSWSRSWFPSSSSSTRSSRLSSSFSSLAVFSRSRFLSSCSVRLASTLAFAAS